MSAQGDRRAERNGGFSVPRCREDDKKKKKDDEDDVGSLPEGWEIRRSRSRNGRVYYVNPIIKVSTWIKPQAGSDKQGISQPEGVTLKSPKYHLKVKQTQESEVSQVKKKREAPQTTASTHTPRSSSETKYPYDSTASQLKKKRIATSHLKDKNPVADIISSVHDKLTAPKSCLETTDFRVSGASLLNKKQTVAEICHSRRSNKRTTDMTGSSSAPSNKVFRTSSSSKDSARESIARCKKSQVHDEKSEKSVTKPDFLTQRAIDRNVSDRNNYCEHLVTKESSTSKNDHINSQGGKTLGRVVLKASRKLQSNQPSCNCSQSESDNSCAVRNVIDTVSESCHLPCSSKIRGLNPVPFIQRRISSRHNKTKTKQNSSPVISSHLTVGKKNTAECNVCNCKYNHEKSHISLHTDLRNQCLHSGSSSISKKHSCHHRNSPYIHKVSLDKSTQRRFDHTTSLSYLDSSWPHIGRNSPDKNDSVSHHKNLTIASSACGSPHSDTWTRSLEDVDWKHTSTATAAGEDTQVDRFNVTSNSSTASDTTGRLPPASGTEVEQDIEDMEVDEELAILSDLQDVRTQTSSMLHQTRGVLTEEVTKAKPLNQSVIDNSFKCTLKEQIILVVDTNVLISCLRFLQDIMNCNIPGYRGIILVMPWVVLQELDYLKNRRDCVNNLSVSTSQRATKAIRFIHHHLVKQSPHVIGQSPMQAVEKTDLPIECNDDRILQCCLQFQRKYPDSLVVLLTRDVNLINKAVIVGITAASNETLSSRLKISKTYFCSRQTSIEAVTSTADVSDPQTSSSPVLPDKPETQKISVQATQKISVQATQKISVQATQKSSVQATQTESDSTQKVTKERERLPQTETEKAVVMNKFEAVWKLIFDMKSQISAILVEGKSHANYSEAVELLKSVRPLLSALEDDFSRCLYLSPVILWEHEAEFAALSTHLNTFYAKAQNSCADPSQSVEATQLIKHFLDSSNRSLLFSGLEQLSTFIKDVEAMVTLCS